MFIQDRPGPTGTWIGVASGRCLDRPLKRGDRGARDEGEFEIKRTRKFGETRELKVHRALFDLRNVTLGKSYAFAKCTLGQALFPPRVPQPMAECNQQFSFKLL
ncbi:hypothetical protein GCM10011329_11580 [Stakelama pacifica]|nr:hypothetical protein GCM10011329_11580 [Stakelama pacifica]